MKSIKILGIVAAITAYPFIITSIILSNWFNFYDNALSDLGNIENNVSISLIFNTGLVLSGLLVAVLAIFFVLKRSWNYLSWAIPLLIASIFLALIGCFPENSGEIHGFVSTTFFLLTAVTLLVYSYCSWPLGSPTTGALALGVAIQETLTSVMTPVWLIAVSLRNA